MTTIHTAATPNPIEALGLADAATLADLDMLTRAARMLTGASSAFISFADTDHLWPASSGAARGEHKPLSQAYCSALLASDEDNLVARNVLLDPRTRSLTRQQDDPSVVAYAGTLLRAEDGRKLGTLCVTDSIERDFDAEQLDLLNGLARQVMNLVSLRATQRELRGALAAMTELACTDMLTGLLNRRAWQEEAEALRKLVLRQSGDLTLVVLDLDHFKRVNDSRGHAAGDAVLRDVGRILRSELRATDRVGRIGGEEFAIAMPFTSTQAAAKRLEQLRSRIAEHLIVHEGDGFSVTVSCGIATLKPHPENIESLMRRADQALYGAKRAGRNRIQVDGPTSRSALRSRSEGLGAALHAAA